MEILIVAPVIFPLILAIVLRLMWKSMRLQRAVNVAGSFMLFCMSLALLLIVYRDGILSVQVGEWQSPFGITLVADMLSAIMVTLAGLMAFAVSIYSVTSMDVKRERFGYYPLLHIMFMGICGAFLTGDIFNLFVWFEVMLIASFVLLSLGSTRSQLKATLKYVTINMFSSILFLTAVGLLYGLTGTLNMADLSLKIQLVENDVMINVVAMLFLIAFGIKAAVFPLFFWLPASYHTPPVAISAIFSALLTKVGVYAMIRVFTLIFVGYVGFTHFIILVIAGFTMVTGVLGAAAQGEMRRILSFHIISQIGYMILGLALYTPMAIAGAVFYLMHHIIVKANLFLVSGLVQYIRGNSELKRSGGMFNLIPFMGILFLIPAMSLAGIPPLSGFWSKFFIVKAGLDAEQYFIIFVALLVGLLTLYSMIKIWNEVFWKEAPPEESIIRQPGSLFTSQGLMLILPVIMLACITLCIGFFPEPFYLMAERASEELLDPGIYQNAVLPER